MNKQIVIDAAGGATGRIAAFAAKQALLGKTVTIVNCNEAAITGRRALILETYSNWVKKGGSSLKGPKITRTPERLMKRTVRGMLSHKKGRGHDAFKRVMCYNTVPAEFESTEKVSMKKEIITKFLTLKEVCKLI